MWRPFLSPHGTERPAGNEPMRAAAFIENNTVVLGGRWGWDWVDVKGQLSGNRGDNLRSIRLMLTRPFPPLCLISSEPPMLVSEHNWIKASQASVRLSLSICTMHSLSIVHFFPPPLLHDLSYLALGGEGMDGGMGWWLKKMGHADKSSVSPLCCKDRDSCDYHILWLISHYLRLIQRYCWLYSHTGCRHKPLTDSIMHIQ